MESSGSAEKIKGRIAEHFSKEIAAIEAEAREEARRIQQEAFKGMELLKAQAATEIEAAAIEARNRVMNEEKLKAKKAFEEAREALIQGAFIEAEKRMEKLASSPEYVRFVKSGKPKEKKMQVIAGNDYLRKQFSGAKLEKGLLGVKIEGENAVYDFSLDGMLKSKREAIRRSVTKELFGE